jgi:hypothetical protein
MNKCNNGCGFLFSAPGFTFMCNDSAQQNNKAEQRVQDATFTAEIMNLC